MIDIHTHLLPYIDDGASDTQEALKMTDALYEQNIDKAVCTPHYDPSQIALDDFLSKRAYSLSMMGSTKLHLISASETYLHDYLFHYPDLSKLCIENTRYILIELTYEKKWDSKVYQAISKLIKSYDLIPIIAHIERYPVIKKNRKHIKRLIDMGCVIQLNTSALLNTKTRKKAFSYIKKGYIDVLGTDCHDLLKRPPVMNKALDLVNQKIGIHYCETFEQNAECIIHGIELRKKKSYIIE